MAKQDRKKAADSGTRARAARAADRRRDRGGRLAPRRGARPRLLRHPLGPSVRARQDGAPAPAGGTGGGGGPRAPDRGPLRGCAGARALALARHAAAARGRALRGCGRPVDAALDRAAAERLGLLHAPRRPGDAPRARHDLRGGRLAPAHARAVGPPGRRGRRRQPARLRLRHRAGERPRDAVLDAHLPGVAHLHDARQPDLRGLVPACWCCRSRSARCCRAGARRGETGRAARLALYAIAALAQVATLGLTGSRGPWLARRRGRRSGPRCCSRPMQGRRRLAGAALGRRGRWGSRSWRSSTSRAARSSACGARRPWAASPTSSPAATRRTRAIARGCSSGRARCASPAPRADRGPRPRARRRRLAAPGRRLRPRDDAGRVRRGLRPGVRAGRAPQPRHLGRGRLGLLDPHPRPLAQRDARQPGDRRGAGARRVPGAGGGRAADGPPARSASSATGASAGASRLLCAGGGLLAVTAARLAFSWAYVGVALPLGLAAGLGRVRALARAARRTRARRHRRRSRSPGSRRRCSATSSRSSSGPRS